MNILSIIMTKCVTMPLRAIGTVHPFSALVFILRERHKQVVVFRLRTNHNKLKQHLYRKFKVGDTDQCPCGEEAQTAEHILKRCQLYKELRVRTWPQPTLEAQKLYGCLTDLQQTAAFISETGLTI